MLLFPLERFDEACIILEKLYPNHFKDCSYYKRNVSTKDQIISPADKQAISQFVALDFELLQIAHTFMDNVINIHFPEERIFNDTLKDFQNRCKKRTTFEKPLHTAIHYLKPSTKKILTYLGYQK